VGQYMTVSSATEIETMNFGHKSEAASQEKPQRFP